MVFTFQLAYMLMMPLAGCADGLAGHAAGIRAGGSGLERGFDATFAGLTPFQFSMARFALGLGEASNFPAAIKTVADWFPRRERAFATGIFNSGSNIGAIIAPLAVPIVAAHFGWRASFIFTGGLDVIWLVFWLGFYRKPSEQKILTEKERLLIESDHEPKSACAYRTTRDRPARHVGVHARQVPHRPRLVVLLVLGTRLSYDQYISTSRTWGRRSSLSTLWPTWLGPRRVSSKGLSTGFRSLKGA